MRVLLTGSSGFIGSHVLEKLVQLNIPTAILLRNDKNPWRVIPVLKNVHIIKLDSKNHFLNDILEFNPNILFNLAWHGVENKFNYDEGQLTTNLDWIRFIFNIAKQAKISTILGVGSQAEYGAIHAPVDEQAPIIPTTLYGAAKVAAHHLLRVLCEQNNIRLMWLRLFSSYGPKDNKSWFIPYLIGELLQQKSPKLTKGDQCWDYIYVTDIAEAMIALAKDPQASGTFNVGSGQAYQIRYISEVIRDQINSSIHLDFGAKPYRNDQIMHLQANISKLQHQIEWQPKISLLAGIENTITWFRAQEILHRENPKNSETIL
jgi:UDP-glucose 4-epimerase